MRLNKELFFRDRCFVPGTVMLTDGIMGHGKTFQSVSFCQEYMENYAVKPTFLLTNVVFGKMTAAGMVDGYPENVFGVKTMKDVFRISGDLLKKHGYDGMVVILLLDEAQNFMAADKHMSDVNLAMIKFLANCRKFGMCVWLMTPTINNLGPRIRNFIDGPKPGVVSVLWRKDMGLIKSYIREHGLTADPKRFTTVKWRSDMDPWVMYVGAPSWTKPKDKLQVGECAYESGAMADFRIGDGFDFDRFITNISGLREREIPAAIEKFYDDMERGDTGEEDYIIIRNREQCLRMARYREDGVTWPKIALYEGEIETTLKSRFTAYFRDNPARMPSSVSGGASKSTNDDGSGSTRARRVRERESRTTQSSEEFFPSGKTERTEGLT